MAESLGDLLLTISNMPNNTHLSKDIEMSANEVSSVKGSIATMPVYIPAMTARMITFLKLSSIPPKSFFTTEILHNFILTTIFFSFHKNTIILYQAVLKFTIASQ